MNRTNGSGTRVGNRGRCGGPGNGPGTAAVRGAGSVTGEPARGQPRSCRPRLRRPCVVVAHRGGEVGTGEPAEQLREGVAKVGGSLPHAARHLLIAGDLASASLIGGIRETLYPMSLPRATRHLDVRLATLGEDAAIRGMSSLHVGQVFSAAAVNTRRA